MLAATRTPFEVIIARIDRDERWLIIASAAFELAPGLSVYLLCIYLIEFARYARNDRWLVFPSAVNCYHPMYFF